MNTIQSGEGKMKSNIDPYARLFTTVLKWQKAEKKWTDGSFLELLAEQIEMDINAFSKEMEDLQKLFKSKFKQQALGKAQLFLRQKSAHCALAKQVYRFLTLHSPANVV